MERKLTRRDSFSILALGPFGVVLGILSEKYKLKNGQPEILSDTRNTSTLNLSFECRTEIIDSEANGRTVVDFVIDHSVWDYSKGKTPICTTFIKPIYEAQAKEQG